MNELSISFLFMILVMLIMLSAFFSGSETSITSLNRYKLQHRASKKDSDALRVIKLLKTPDKILSTMLIGNTFSNIFASSIATIAAIRIYDDLGAIIAPIILTIIVLIFAEIAPKTVATLYPEKIAYPASKILKIANKVFSPLVIVVNTISNFLLTLCGIQTKKSVFDPLTKEELRGMLKTQKSSNNDMLVGVLDLEQVTVNGVMIPRNEIKGLDLDAPWSEIMKTLIACHSKDIIVYKNVIDDVIGILELTSVISLLEKSSLNKRTIARNVKAIEYIPEGTSLQKQLKNFQQQSYNKGLIIDEYGETLGLIQLEDILEEITGELYQQPHSKDKIQVQKDGNHIIPGSYSVRDVNRILNWNLPTNGPTTISGLIIEHLETLPEGKVCCKITQYKIEIVKYKDNKIFTAMICQQQN